MATIAEIRSKYPQYSDMSDEALAGALHQKFYSDMPVEEFNQKVGLKPAMTAGQQVGYTALGAGKELAGQAAAVGKQFKEAFGPGGAALGYTPEQESESTQFFKSAKQAIQHPVDTARGALTDWMEKALPTPTTPQQAEERGGAIVRGAENVIPAGGAVRDIAGVLARPLERAAAPLAEKVAARGEAKAAALNVERSAENTKIARLKEMGYGIQPTIGGGGVLGRAGEAVSGQLETEYQLSRKNAKVSNRKAAAEIGIDPKTPLAEDTVAAKKTEAESVYKKVRDASKTIGRITPDSDFVREVEGALDRTAEEKQDFPKVKHPRIEEEIEAHKFENASTGSILERIKDLRQSASRNMRALSNDDFELGLAQKKIATALENQLDRSLARTNPTLIEEFRAARTQLAKIYNIEDALTPNGNISPAVLARQLDRGVPLSGGLKEIAEAYKMNKRAMRTVDDLGGKGEFSRLDVLVGGAEMLAHPAKAGVIMAGLGARPLARAIVTGKAYQKAAIGPKVAKPGAVSREARKIAEAGKKPAQTLESTAQRPKLKVKMKPQTLQSVEESE